MSDDTYTGTVCVDCYVFVNTGESPFAGTIYDDEATFLWWKRRLDLPTHTGKDLGFHAHDRCDCCDTMLGGDRYEGVWV